VFTPLLLLSNVYPVAAPVITTATSSTVNIVDGAPLTLSCTSEGSPPDTFTWMKDGVPIAQSTSITRVIHTRTRAVFHTDFTISSVTASDSGTYTCTVTNPIGSNTRSINVVVASSTGEYKSNRICDFQCVQVKCLTIIHLTFYNKTQLLATPI